jgi:excinuclease UvrABC nuclease subunit
VQQLDELLESATQFIETSIAPLEQQLPAAVTQLTTKAFEQAREVRSQIRQRVTAS